MRYLFLLSVLFYCTNAQVGLSDTNQARKKAFDWLISEWNPETGGWEESHTARILTALQLIDSNWLFNPNNPKALPTLRRMNADIFAGLRRTGNMSTMSGEEGAEMVNGLLATCQNPRDFYGYNLIDMLTRRIQTIPSGPKTKNVVQIIASVLALCNAGAPVPISAIQRINTELKPTSGSCPYCIEASSVAIVAMKCVKQQLPNEQMVHGINTRQIAYIKGKQSNDGGFGNLVGTALATQAANAIGTVNLPVNVAASLAYIIADQDAKGSFGNTVLNALVLPTLIGRSMLDVKGVSLSCPNIQTLSDMSRAADPNFPTPITTLTEKPLPLGKIRLMLSVEDTIYAQRIVETTIETKAGQTLLQVMNEWSRKHPRAFQFTTVKQNGITQLSGVNSVTNDDKNKWSWQSFRTAAGSNVAERTSAGLDKTPTENGDQILFRFG